MNIKLPLKSLRNEQRAVIVFFVGKKTSWKFGSLLDTSSI